MHTPNGGVPHWIRCRSEGAPQARLFCLPYAGGSATVFGRWQKHLPRGSQLCLVELRGRGCRSGEEVYTNARRHVHEVCEAMRALLDLPILLFGHSMGALLAYELAHALTAIGIRPAHVIVSGHRAPHLPSRGRRVHQFSRDELIDELRSLDGIPAEVLDAPDFLDCILPIVRTDFEVVETYAYHARPPLTCDVTVLGGNEDATVSVDELRPWREHTRGRCDVHVLSGGHFFIRSAAAEELISRTVAAVVSTVVTDRGATSATSPLT
jgi:medium-chain acyl-[acyl-carrier-protein] hydrolase